MSQPEAQRPPEDRIDPALLARVVRRDRAALEAFFDHYFDRVYAHVVRTIGDRTVADDLVQDIFLRMHRSIESLDPDRDPSGWVFTIAVNVIRDHWRSRKRAAARGPEVDVDDLWEQPAAGPGSDPHRELVGEETQALIERALEKLSPADREILALRRMQELDTAQVADILSINAEAVRQRLSRAVSRLAKAYRELSGEGVTES